MGGSGVSGCNPCSVYVVALSAARINLLLMAVGKNVIILFYQVCPHLINLFKHPTFYAKMD